MFHPEVEHRRDSTTGAERVDRRLGQRADRSGDAQRERGPAGFVRWPEAHRNVGDV
jgi:hypothetical protein